MVWKEATWEEETKGRSRDAFIVLWWPIKQFGVPHAINVIRGAKEGVRESWKEVREAAPVGVMEPQKGA